MYSNKNNKYKYSTGDKMDTKCYIGAGLILCQGYVPDSHENWKRKYWTQNSHLQQCISWGSGDWQPHPIQCTTVPVENIYAVYSVYIHLYAIYLFIPNAIKM